MYHLHSDTAECLGGLASGTLVDHFSVLRGGPEPVFSGGGVGWEQNPVNGGPNISSDSCWSEERCPWPQ